MSKIFEDIRREERETGRLEGFRKGGRMRSMQIALRMLAAGTNSVEEIADITAGQQHLLSGNYHMQYVGT